MRNTDFLENRIAEMKRLYPVKTFRFIKKRLDCPLGRGSLGFPKEIKFDFAKAIFK
jgi:hypothetical protein